MYEPGNVVGRLIRRLCEVTFFYRLIRHKVARAVTDSGRDVIFDPVGKPGVANLLTILAACTGITPMAATAQLDTYSELKEAVTAAISVLVRCNNGMRTSALILVRP